MVLLGRNSSTGKLYRGSGGLLCRGCCGLENPDTTHLCGTYGYYPQYLRLSLTMDSYENFLQYSITYGSVKEVSTGINVNITLRHLYCVYGSSYYLGKYGGIPDYSCGMITHYSYTGNCLAPVVGSLARTTEYCYVFYNYGGNAGLSASLSSSGTRFFQTSITLSPSRSVCIEGSGSYTTNSPPICGGVSYPTIYGSVSQNIQQYLIWLSGGNYYASCPDKVTHNDVHYTCISNHTASATNEPGVGVDWQTYWKGGA